MKLYYTKRSPYARKVRIVALEKDIALEYIEEDLTKKSSGLLQANPVGKIPTLVLDNENALCDSPLICEYLDNLKESHLLIPSGGDARYQTLNIAAIADGLMDITVLMYLEKIRHPQDFHEEFVSNQEVAIKRCLTFFEGYVKQLQPFDMAAIAVASALGYIQFRLPQLAEKNKFPGLLAWFEKVSQRPSLASTLPG